MDDKLANRFGFPTRIGSGIGEGAEELPAGRLAASAQRRRDRTPPTKPSPRHRADRRPLLHASSCYRRALAPSRSAPVARRSSGLAGLLAAFALVEPMAGCGPDRCGGLACLDHAVGLATDEVYLYYLTDSGALGRLDKAGGDLEPLIPSGVRPQHGLVRHGRNLFWRAGGQLMRASIDGGSATPSAPADLFAVDADNLYLFVVPPDAKSRNGDIVQLPCAGGAAQVLVRDVWVQDALAVGGGFVYYDRIQWDLMAPPEFGMWRVPIGGGAPERLGDDAPSRIFVSGNRVIFCRTSSTLRVLEAGQVHSLQLACPDVVDGDQLFGSRDNSSSPIIGEGPPPTVWSAALDGAERTLVTASGIVWSLTTDDEYVYYADEQPYEKSGFASYERGWHGRLSRVHR